jgi:hypothetical protein
VANSINAVVDNWLLTLAGDMLDPDVTERLTHDRGALEERTEALLHLLDVLVLHDVIFYDSEHASIWDHHPTLGQLTVTFSRIPLDTPTRRQIVDAADVQLDENSQAYLARTLDLITKSEQTYGIGDLIQQSIAHGSIFYLALANLLGANYWPAPRRARFLAESAFKQVHPTFAVLVQNSVNKELAKIVDAVLGELGYETSQLVFPGFGGAILAECSSLDSILPTALEVRASREAEAFRNWLNEMQQSLDSGSVSRIARGLTDVRSVASECEKKLGLHQETSSDVSLQIGLSPTFSFTGATIRSIFGAFRSRPLHLSFLRRHFKSCIEDIDLTRRIGKMMTAAARRSVEHT